MLGGFFCGLIMSYLVLARKYRPQTLSDVLGQNATINTLKSAIENDRLGHAFLFCGCRGVGKTSVARALAKSLVCEKGPISDPCLKCQNCVEITQGNALDVIEIDGASHTGVDDIRELRESIRFQPAKCRFKVVILDEVHMLSTSAFNALLKTLEEPPAHVKFIFATTESHKIPATILSRCQRYDFKRLTRGMIGEQIERIAKAENFALKPEIIQMVAECADGSMRDAQSLLDQILSFVGPDASLETVAEVLGTVERPLIVELSAQLAHKETAAAISTAQKLSERGIDLRRFLESLCQEFRHLCLAASAGTLNGYIDFSEDDRQSILERSKSLPYLEWERLFSITLKGVDELSQSQHAQLHIELLFLQICTRPDQMEAVEIQKAIQMLQSGQSTSPLPSRERPGRMESGRGEGAATAKISPQPTEKPAPAPVRMASHTPRKKLQLKDVDQEWLAFVEDVGNMDPVLGSHLEHAKLVDKCPKGDGFELKLSFDRRVHFETVEQEKMVPEIQSVLDSHFGKGTRFSCELLGSIPKPAATPAPAPKPAQPPPPNNDATINQARKETHRVQQNELRQAALADPVVKQALEIFGGEIRNIERV